MPITVELSKMGALFQRMAAESPQAIRRGLLSAAAQMVPIMVRATDNAPPASARGSKGAVNTGDYRRRWTAHPDNQKGVDGVLVGNSAPQAGVIEYGRRPGARRPPVESIARWAQRKLGLAYPEARGIAFAMARNIGKRGLRPRRVLTSFGTKFKLRQALIRDVLHEYIVMWRRG